MDVALYTGNGTTQSITGLAFSPDFVWIKCRSSANGHALMDVVRGSSQRLFSELTDAEDGTASLTSFDSNGFSVSTVGGVSGRTNQSSQTYAGWCWDAGTSTVSNTQGSITSQVRANPTAGFSVVTYTGNLSSSGTSTVGHGLGVAPSMVITKKRSGASAWTVQHKSLATANTLIDLNSTAATYTSAYGTIVAPTSSVFTIAWLTSMGDNGSDYVAYCFSPVVGYSNFGSYTGNGSTDGPFIYTGFRSRWVMIKRSDSASSSYGWFILDTARNTYNVMNTWLAADSATSDGADVICDTLSNGFKIRTTAGNINTNAGTFIYAAFAEAPINYSRAR
jgi:hypothetical protein